eukprot:jgi/Tetstr1/461816/TSEL_006897.t1
MADAASRVLSDEVLMAELMAEFQQLKAEGPTDFDFDAWIQRRLRGLASQPQPQSQLAFSRAAMLPAPPRPYHGQSYADRLPGGGQVDVQRLDTSPPNQLQFLHPRPAAETRLQGYKPKFFERPRTKLVAANKENQGGYIALRGEGGPDDAAAAAAAPQLQRAGPDGEHLRVARGAARQQPSRPRDYEEDELWMGAVPSSYAGPDRHNPDRLLPRNSKGQPLRPACLQPWASVAELQRTLQRSEQVPARQAVGEK